MRTMATRTRRPRHRWVPALGLLVGVTMSLTAIAALYDATTQRPWAPPAGLTYVDTGGYATRFIALGPRRAHPIVLIHGAFESADTWKSVARLLGRRFHVEAYDLKGYGYTERRGPYDISALADQLAAFLSVRHLTHPILVGHSLGAGVIARFVLNHPHVAAGIVFLDGDGLTANYPTWVFRDLVPEPFRTALYRSLLSNDLLVGEVFALACGPQCRPLTHAQLDTFERPFFVAGAEQAFFTIASHPLVGVTMAQRHELSMLSTPSLVIVGAHDPELSPQQAAAAARDIGAPSPTVLSGDGHLALWSDPLHVAQALAAFCDRLASTTPVG